MHTIDRNVCIIPASADASAKMTVRRHFAENHPLWLDHHDMSKVRVQ
jgi:hypothetical protein